MALRFNNTTTIALFCACIGSLAFAQRKLDSQIDAAIALSQKQCAYLGTQVEAGRYPKTFADAKVETSDSGWWCSGFYPGTLLYLDEAKPNLSLRNEAFARLAGLKKEQFNTSTHDLGFMMFCSFGNAERLNPKPEYEQILMNSAKSLSSRFVEKSGCIQSWDAAPWNKAGIDEMPVIIDNMMNLELLFWATRFSGDSSYYRIAKRHADTTMKHHFRSDYSSYHVVVYNKNTGDVAKRITNQGAADASAWARGQAWGLYGYTVVFRETRDKKYLEQAQHIADFILNHPNLPKDKIPYWDFNAPGVASAGGKSSALRDSSAGAILASALLELAKYSDSAKASVYFDAAQTMLQTLLSPEYLAQQAENGGFLLKHGVGNMPNHTEIDTPLTYGDYYFVEAMKRYKAF